MAEKPTFASVTSTPCTCGALQRHADDPHIPIRFDDLTHEFHLAHGPPGAAGALVLYHCPFCGGAAPTSKRPLLFAQIPLDEQQRLSKILNPLRTLQQAIDSLGPPDRDQPSGRITMNPESNGSPPTAQHHRVLTYEHLSPVATIAFIEDPAGHATWMLTGKYLGPPLQP